MSDLFWTVFFAQVAMGAADTLFHHEGTERLAWRPSQAQELRLHGIRNLAYAVLFGALGWCDPRGLWAAALLALLAGELIITLWDFVEEDRTRKLPASERVLHTLLTLNYGVLLALLVPWLLTKAGEPTELVPAFHGWISWLCALAALAVVLSGARDLAAAARCARLVIAPPAALASNLSAPQHFLVTGGTGFIGSRLVTVLAAAGHHVTVLCRDRLKALALTATGTVRLVTSLDEIAADTPIGVIINLAGAPIAKGPWTGSRRLAILRSRLQVTHEVLRLIKRLQQKPSVLISGSAVGWYGLRANEPLTEQSDGRNCFSRRVCVSWERAATKAAKLGLRVVLLRTGLVLDGSGGLLSRLLTPFEFGLGGPIGSGQQWMSWIHRDDLVRLILHAVVHEELQGPLNAVAPQPVTNRQFSAALGRALRRPAFLTMPAKPLRWLLGDFAHELLLSGQRVLPRAAEGSGFVFRYATLESAFQAIVGSSSPSLPAAKKNRREP